MRRSYCCPFDLPDAFRTDVHWYPVAALVVGMYALSLIRSLCPFPGRGHRFCPPFMHLLDWLIVLLPVAVVIAIALHTRRYLRSVADFVAGGRHAGRYLLCTARSEMGAGAVAYVSYFEFFQHSGFAVRWWSLLSVPVGLILTITGFVLYRFRQTRALTLAQFFEIRYSRRFRLFTGGLALFSGLLNFGIIPVIGARFMVYFLECPQGLSLFGFMVPTYLVVMACSLTACTLFTVAGGQITVMITDCVQGVISQIFYVIIAVAVLITFSWPHTRAVLLAHPAGQSMVNPFDSYSVKDFNLWFVLMGLVSGVYGTMAWQNSAGFNSAAATPHESRMGAILGSWRAFALSTMMILLAVCALTYLGEPAGAASVAQASARIPDAHTAQQMSMSIGLSQILPVGIKGLLVAVVLMGIFGGDGMHLHSWSSIFIQDVVLPLRKQPLTTRQHLILLRLSVVGVALFAFCFGALFHQTEYVAMWFLVTMAIYIGGAGACIIGGLYWSRGTTAGAWTGLLVGSVLSTGGILLRQPVSTDWLREMLGWPGTGARPFAGWLLAHTGDSFPLNGVEIGFYSALVASAAYCVVSLLTCRTPHNMDQLLHRGPYQVEGEAADEPIAGAAKAARSRFHIHHLVGIDEHFTRSDRWVALGIFYWSLFWLGIFLVGSAWNFVSPWPVGVWANYWLVTGIYLPLLISLATTVWFTIGCWGDIRRFFARLKVERVDARDDGTVTGPHDVLTPLVPPRARAELVKTPASR